MAREFTRSDRVAQQIQRDVATIIQRDLRDPTIGMVTVSDVEVSRDLAYAKIFVSALLQDDAEMKKSLEKLNESAPYVRSLLAKSIRMRSVPNIKFCLDNSLNEGIRMSRLVDDAIAKDQAKSKIDDADDSQVNKDDEA
ncbi:30S ribosome-binding factor RbfA [Catenovulum maritimum]|uniref:Ribosome-binding factor A n=1 Tax=Catenovulum maritimum TaxID=1513271 RepID=A0A0J8GS05_9ALTE|nr:30S ribosome-binding factor RbfA [Catenovulum maritimum]KMT64079.1 ribosome-binding factor A [Catenovulum maritimum]